MIDEYNLVEGDEEFIDGSMELGTESPLEMNENKNVRKMNESQFRNLIYETVLEMLDEQLNENDPMAAGAPMPPAPGAPMDPLAGPGAGVPAPAAATDADTLPGEAKKAFKDAEARKDPNGGAKGFAPQDAPKDDKDKEDKDKEDKDKKKKDKEDKDKKKKELAEKISRHVLKQIVEQFGKKK
jgi:hypothetical protein